MNKKIYIITSGEYSDYDINMVFSTKELAEEFIQHNGDDYRIEEYNIDEPIVRRNKLWLITFNVETGELDSATTTNYKVEERKDTCQYCDKYISTPRMYLYVYTETMDKAKKIASERFVAIKANEYIWLRLTRPYYMDRYGIKKYERFNVKTNEFTKDQEL